MEKRIFYTQITLIIAMLLAGCAWLPEPAAAEAKARGKTSPTTSVDAKNMDTIKVSITGPLASDRDVVLSAPAVQLVANWGSYLKPGVSAFGRYQMSRQSDHDVMIVLIREGCDASPDTTLDKLVVFTAFAQVGELWDSSLNQDDSVVGRYEMKLLPSDEDLIKLSRRGCE